MSTAEPIWINLEVSAQLDQRLLHANEPRLSHPIPRMGRAAIEGLAA